MDNQFIRGLAAGGLLVVLSLVLPSETQAQQRSGVEIWEANCGRCHMIQPTNKYTANDWRSVGIHMGITARLTSAERDAVIAFLVSGARTAAAGQAPARSPAATQASISASSGLVPASNVMLTGEQIAQMVSSLAAAPTPTVTRTGNR